MQILVFQVPSRIRPDGVILEKSTGSLLFNKDIINTFRYSFDFKVDLQSVRSEWSVHHQGQNNKQNIQRTNDFDEFRNHFPLLISLTLL